LEVEVSTYRASIRSLKDMEVLKRKVHDLEIEVSKTRETSDNLENLSRLNNHTPPPYRIRSYDHY
jgi:hypothetical protein